MTAGPLYSQRRSTGVLLLQYQVDGEWRTRQTLKFYPTTSRSDDMLSREDATVELEKSASAWYHRVPQLSVGVPHRVVDELEMLGALRHVG